ncbi:unnamed protein product [Fusarium graminearum]|nr:unnamed protein product [Fusarium graminearum]
MPGPPSQPQSHSMYRPPQHCTSTPLQNHMGDPARYKVTKPTFHNRYECRPGHASDGPVTYSLKVSKDPDLSFSAEGIPMGACYLPNYKRVSRSDVKSFKIVIGRPPDVQYIQMIHRGNDDYGWTFMFNLPNTGQPIPMTWKKDNNVAVDGMHASSLSDNNFKLQDPNGQLMAVFTSHTMSLRLSAVSTMQINMDLGPIFEYAVIMSLLSIYEYQKREEDENSTHLNAAAGVAAASSC